MIVRALTVMPRPMATTVRALTDIVQIPRAECKPRRKAIVRVLTIRLR